MPTIREQDGALIYEYNHETVCLEPWGADALRVRSTRNGDFADVPHALLPAGPAQAVIRIDGGHGATITNGKIQARVDADGRIHYLRSDTGEVLLEEVVCHILKPPARSYKAVGGEHFLIEARFDAAAGERFYGLGQHRHGLLNQKGCVLDLVQQNCEINIPFAVSSRMYGFLWNMPAIGRVELGQNGTRWVARASRQMDYWIVAGDSYADLMARYGDATGHPPMLPEFAAGFWQCKLRYRTQEELLSVAREYKRRGLPLSVIVIDFFHWKLMGEWKLDERYWPDPAAMVRELKDMGVELMISVWPAVNPLAAGFAEMKDRGLLLRTDRGVPVLFSFMDNNSPQFGSVQIYYIDPTHPQARQYIWDRCRENYYRHGMRVFWLDACEPEMPEADFDNVRYHAGNGLEVGCLYPLMVAKAFHDGMTAEGEQQVINLCRSAWAGSQRYGAAVWSGDIESKFEVLTAQVRAGLNIGMSGIPWWTTDIGGFLGGDPESEYFRELIVRWFQYGVFCPLFRLHGVRLPSDGMSGGPNEVWSFGERAYSIITGLLQLRERLRPYIMEQMKLAHEKLTPPMRPVFFDFAHDAQTATIEDQFLFGPDIMVCPVTQQGATSRRVYLPAGATWTDAWTSESHAGGQWLDAAAPIERIPVYLRDGRLDRSLFAQP